MSLIMKMVRSPTEPNLRSQVNEIELEARFLQAEPVTGKCYVLTFSAAHNLTLADLPPREIVPVINAWTEIYTAPLSPTSPLAQNASSTTIQPISHETSPAKPN